MAACRVTSLPTHCLAAFVLRTEEAGTDAGRVKDLPASHWGRYQHGQLFHSAFSLD